MNSSTRILSAILPVLSLCLSGCERQNAKTIATQPTPVTVSHPITQTVVDYSDLTGRTSAVETVEVRARVAGYLERINFKEGELVKKGDLLCEIDPRPYQAQVNFAKAQLAANEAILKKASADNVRNKALALKSPGAVTQQDLDQYQAAEDQAIANVGTARATLETNELNLGFTRIISPIDGRTSRYNVTVGNLVQEDTTLLTTIVSVDPMYAYVDVDEHTVLHVRKLIREGKAQSARDVDLHVKLGLANKHEFPRDGVVNFVDNEVNPKTGTLRLRAVFSNSDEFLTPGLFARVRIPIGTPYEAMLVTDRAIDTDQGQKIVYIVDKDNKVDSRPVTLGSVHDGLRVIESGIEVTDRVIVNGLQRVRPGVTVDPKLVEMPGGRLNAQASQDDQKSSSPAP